MLGRTALPVLVSALCLSLPETGVSQDDTMLGKPFVLTGSKETPNGAWSWGQDPQAIIDPRSKRNPLLLVSTVSSAKNGDAESGDVDLLWRYLRSGKQGTFEIHHRLERDDHDACALYMRRDGHYVAMYAMHDSDRLTRWRISAKPHDPTAWRETRTLNTRSHTVFNNIHLMPRERGRRGRLYNFPRVKNLPRIQVSEDQGIEWQTFGPLLNSPKVRVRYASDSRRVHLITTDGDPDKASTSLHHGVFADGVLRDSAGEELTEDLLSSKNEAEPPSPNALTLVFKNGSKVGDAELTHAVPVDVELDSDGHPAAVFSARASDQDHRYLYARHNGKRWQVQPLAAAGPCLLGRQPNDTGMVAIDPDDVSVVFMSSKLDPRGGAATEHFELYRGETRDDGSSWDWTPITERSTVDNLRPLVPRWDKKRSAVLWMRGTYTDHTEWDTQVYGLVLSADGKPGW